MKKIKVAILSLLAVCAIAQTIPNWDASGNSQLEGRYNFRHIAYITSHLGGDMSKKILLHGTINFDGNGGYTISATQLDTRNEQSLPSRVSYAGTYRIAENGYGYLSNPVVKNSSIYGSISSGVFIGASTESGFNDLLIATPAPQFGTTPIFHGQYSMVAMDVPSNNHKDISSFTFPLKPNGYGSLGEISITGFVAGSPQPVKSVMQGSYSLAGNRVTVLLPLGDGKLLSGNQMIHTSTDGTFIFGGSSDSFNMIVGVKVPSSAQTQKDLEGLFYQAGIDHDASEILNKNQSILSSFHGSFRAKSGMAINHQRLNSLIYPKALDYTFTDNYSLNHDGTASDTFQRYWITEQGKIRVGIGNYPYLGISVSAKVPVMNGPGVFINSTSIRNAGSEAPFTAALSPGELVTLSGKNLAPGSAVYEGSIAPKQLAGVQVLINGVSAPVVSVNRTEITFVVPYSIRALASLQVNNNGQRSNTVTTYVNATSPGLYTIPSGGSAAVAAAHVDNTPVTADNPARTGDILQLYLTGLGIVNPENLDGMPGPISPLAKTVDRIQVYVDGKAAEVKYSGLAPNYIGLYQLNIVVPDDIRSGDVYVDVSGVDADTSQAYLSIIDGSKSNSGTLKSVNSQNSHRAGQRRWRLRSMPGEIPNSLRTGHRHGVFD